MFRYGRFTRPTESSETDQPPGPGRAATDNPAAQWASANPAHTPASAIRVARIGGTIADVAAAAFSAHTLYHLGGQLDLGPWTAWLLPATLDVFAFTALAVGYSLPVDHPGQKQVLRTARLAFAMTISSNFLDHFLQKAGQLVDPTVRDLLLVVVATMPSLVVERLLKLQSQLNGRRAAEQGHEGGERPDCPSIDQPVGQGTLAHKVHADQMVAAGPATDDHRLARTDHSAARPGLHRPDWTIEGAPAFADLSLRLGRRPSAREFQQELASLTKALIASGYLAAGARSPSITTAKRVRAALEAGQSLANK
ncbi:hypothetical protein ABIA31_002899 [Catenulispora sp. MAP5-51]|uniref:DUF2637 domain-containing protein n=1 Tax=Catenulispora sp. MAP5-51 TaxID=3156298 RepID=UPI0035198165